MKITLQEVRRFQELAGLTESQIERQLLSTKPGDKLELTLDDDTKQQCVRVGTNSQNEPTFKLLKNDKPVSRESALAVSFIKAVKPIVTRQLTGDPDADWLGEASEVYTDWKEYVNPDYILVTLKNGRKLKIEKKSVRGGQKVYQAILQAFNDEKHAVTDKVVDAMAKQLGEEQLNEFDATSFFQGQMIQQAMQSAPQAMSEADKIITYVLMTVGIGAVAGGLAAVAKDKLGSLNPIPAIKQWWADRQKRKALEPIITKLKQDPEVMKYVSNKNMRGIQNAIKSKLTPEEQKYIGSLTRSTLSELNLNEVASTDFAKAGLELVSLAKSLVSKAGESLMMNSEVKKASTIKDADGLSELYYALKDVLGDLIGSEGAAFAKEAKRIIADKYKITMTDEYGFPMKWN